MINEYTYIQNKSHNKVTHTGHNKLKLEIIKCNQHFKCHKLILLTYISYKLVFKGTLNVYIYIGKELKLINT